jgi:hypothetical protein
MELEMDASQNMLTGSGEISARCVDASGGEAGVCAVKSVRTKAGLELLVGAALTGEKIIPAGDQNHSLTLQIEQAIQASEELSITALMQAVVEETGLSRAGKQHTSAKGMIAVMQGKRLYLTQVGAGRAYLVRSGRVTQLTYEHNLASDLLNLEKTLPLHVVGQNKRPKQNLEAWNNSNPGIDMRIKAPEGSRTHLDLQPEDRVALMGVAPGQTTQAAAEWLHDYLAASDSPSKSMGESGKAVDATTAETQPFPIVIIDQKSTSPAQAAGQFNIGWLRQLGTLAILLAVSVAIGLLAAYEVPLAMNPKPLPDTVLAAEQPGFLSVAAEDGLAQAVYQGKAPLNLAPGTLIDAQAGMRVQTNRGTVKLQLSDGTQIYVGNNSSVTLTRIADPKQRQMDSTVVLNKGQILLDISHGSGGAAKVVAGDKNQISLTGEFIGVTYAPGTGQVDADCLQGACRLADGQAGQDLQSGQHVSSQNGRLGGLDLARWSTWDFLCDSDCPSQSNQTGQTASQP